MDTDFKTREKCWLPTVRTKVSEVALQTSCEKIERDTMTDVCKVKLHDLCGYRNQLFDSAVAYIAPYSLSPLHRQRLTRVSFVIQGTFQRNYSMCLSLEFHYIFLHMPMRFLPIGF